MTPELYALVAAIFVQVITIGIGGMVMSRELGLDANTGPRDALPRSSALLGRFRRAIQNGFEGLTLFAPAALMVAFSGQSSSLTATAAWVYVLARLCYTPAYLFPYGRMRSFIWLISLAATLTLLVSALV